jgi:hypothetical protein
MTNHRAKFDFTVHTVNLSSRGMSVEELLGLAESSSLRVIAKSGESYVVSRLVA